jgi:hypothetical protein
LNESKCKAKRFINSILFDAAKLVEKYIWVVRRISQNLERTKEKVTIADLVDVKYKDLLKNM